MKLTIQETRQLSNFIDKVVSTFESRLGLPAAITENTKVNRRQYFSKLVFEGYAYDSEYGHADNLFDRAFNKEMVAFLRFGFRYEKKFKKDWSSRDLAAVGSTKASTDGTYCLKMGLVEVVRRVKGINYHRLTAHGRDAVRGDAHVPISFTVLRGNYIRSSTTKARLEDLEDQAPTRKRFKVSAHIDKLWKRATAQLLTAKESQMGNRDKPKKEAKKPKKDAPKK